MKRSACRFPCINSMCVSSSALRGTAHQENRLHCHDFTGMTWKKPSSASKSPSSRQAPPNWAGFGSKAHRQAVRQQARGEAMVGRGCQQCCQRPQGGGPGAVPPAAAHLARPPSRSLRPAAAPKAAVPERLRQHGHAATCAEARCTACRCSADFASPVERPSTSPLPAVSESIFHGSQVVPNDTQGKELSLKRTAKIVSVLRESCW